MSIPREEENRSTYGSGINFTDHLDRDTQAWPEIDVAAYHGLVGEVVRAIGPHTEADPVALLLQYLTHFGNVVGRSPHFQVEGDKHHANLYVTLIGQTSKARKGTSAGRVRQLFKSCDEAWESGNIHSGLSSGEGLIWCVRDQISEMIPKGKGAQARRELEVVDIGIVDKRILVLESEFAGLLTVMQRQGNTLSRVIRDAWDRGDLAILTKNSPARATGAHISIVGHITEEELRYSLNQVNMANGFANRFLFAVVKRSQKLPFGGNADDEVIRHLGERTRKAAEIAQTIGRVKMTKEACDDWVRIYSDLSEGKPGLLGSITGRAEAHTVRLAMVYALLDGKDMIESCHLWAALAVWEYCETSARRVFGELTGMPIVDDLIRALGCAGAKGMTRTDIRDFFRRHRSQGGNRRGS